MDEHSETPLGASRLAVGTGSPIDMTMTFIHSRIIHLRITNRR
jgi:hypothetical protein